MHTCAAQLTRSTWTTVHAPQELDLSNLQKLVDVAPLGACAGLRELDLFNCVQAGSNQGGGQAATSMVAFPIS